MSSIFAHNPDDDRQEIAPGSPELAKVLLEVKGSGELTTAAAYRDWQAVTRELLTYHKRSLLAATCRELVSFSPDNRVLSRKKAVI